jgi:hypothetical protein
MTTGWVKAALCVVALSMGATACAGINHAVPSKSTHPSPASGASAGTVQGAQLVAVGTGWAVSKSGLSFTTDRGATWRNITPAGLNPDHINAAYFLDQSTGWVGAVTPTSGPSSDLRIYRTVDAGQTWSSAVVDSGVAYTDAAQSHGNIDFLNANTGYFDFALASSTAARSGVLFKSSDGGATWTKESLPPYVFGPIAFTTSTHGWVAGFQGDTRLYVTSDSGGTWQVSSLSSSLPKQGGISLGIPSFVASASTDVTVTGTQTNAVSVQVFKTDDQGGTWKLVTTQPLGGANAPASSLTSSGALVVANSNALADISATGSTTTVTPSGLPPAGGVDALSFATPSNGWAIVQGGSCVNKTNCVESSDLFQTADGGVTWSEVTVP